MLLQCNNCDCDDVCYKVQAFAGYCGVWTIEMRSEGIQVIDDSDNLDIMEWLLVSLLSKEQPTAALSTVETESRAAAQATRERNCMDKKKKNVIEG
jgi:hypothetical protein